VQHPRCRTWNTTVDSFSATRGAAGKTGGNVPSESHEDDFMFRAEILDGRPSTADLSPEEVIEDLRDVLAGFKVELWHVLHEDVE
jgi:hypothetical protein